MRMGNGERMTRNHAIKSLHLSFWPGRGRETETNSLKSHFAHGAFSIGSTRAKLRAVAHSLDMQIQTGDDIGDDL